MNPLNGIFWRGVSITLGAIILILGIFGGGKLYLLSRDLDKASQALKEERETSSDLRAEIRTQNVAIGDLKSKSDIAQARYEAALQAAGITGNKVDSILRSISGMKKGISCQDAMPAVNKALEGLK